MNDCKGIFLCDLCGSSEAGERKKVCLSQSAQRATEMNRFFELLNEYEGSFFSVNSVGSSEAGEREKGYLFFECTWSHLGAAKQGNNLGKWILN